MKVEVNFKMKHILKRNVDSLHHHHHHHRNSRRRRRRQQQQEPANLQRNFDQLLTVKRALFVDSNLIDHHRETSEFLKAELDKIDNEHCARYNFDFKNELPLEGNYQWIKLSSKSSSSSSTIISPSSSSPTTTTTVVETKVTSTSSPSSLPIKVSNWTQNLPDERDDGKRKKNHQQLRLKEKVTNQQPV